MRKQFSVPFTITLTGSIVVLANSLEEANDALESAALGVDMDNLLSEGVLHDGSVCINSMTDHGPDYGEPTALAGSDYVDPQSIHNYDEELDAEEMEEEEEDEDEAGPDEDELAFDEDENAKGAEG